MTSPQFLCFSGSSRQGSLNAKLAAAVATHLTSAGKDAQVISLADFPLPLYDGDLEEQDGIPKEAVALARLVAGAKGVFVANPEYNASLTPLLKNSLDWMSRVKAEDIDGLSVWKNKVWAIGGASPGGFGGVRAIGHLRQVLVALGGLVLSEQVLLPGASSAFNEDGALTADRPKAMLEAMVQKMIEISDS